MAPSFVKLLLLAATSTTAALTATTIEELASSVHIPVGMVVDILNTPDSSTVNIDDWAGLLQQPVEAVHNWPADVKSYVLSELSAEVSLLVAPHEERRELSARAESIRAVERRLLSIHNTRIQSGRNGCFENIPCGACVVAAGFVGTSGIAGCIGAALTAIGGTAGTSTPLVVTAAIECGGKVAGATTAAIGVCHSAL